MSKAKFAAAKEFIDEKKYDEARSILKTIDHPTAREWEAKLDKLSSPSTAKTAEPAPKKGNRLIYKATVGCIGIFVVIIVLGTLLSNALTSISSAIGATTTSRPDVRDTPTHSSSVTIIPTVVSRSGFVTITPKAGTVYPTATITDTPQPTVTNTDSPTETPAPQITPMEPQIYYTVSTVNLRSCPNTSCSIVQKVGGDAPLAVDGIVAGEEIDTGNPYWYKVEQSETDEYGYSRFFSASPVQQQIPPTAAPVQQFTVPTSAPSGTIICNDGYVWPSTVRQGACHGHKGIRN